MTEGSMAEQCITLRTCGRRSCDWVQKKEEENASHNPLKEEAFLMT